MLLAKTSQKPYTPMVLTEVVNKKVTSLVPQFSQLVMVSHYKLRLAEHKTLNMGALTRACEATVKSKNERFSVP